MLILSRQVNESIVVGSMADPFILTIVQIRAGRVAWVVRRYAEHVSKKGRFAPPDVVTGNVSTTFEIGPGATGKIFDIRSDKVRIAINTPSNYQVHRLEVYEAIHHKLGDSDDEDNFTGGPRVPRPSSPQLPTLDVRLNEPDDSADDI
jgi:carbon storage regulator CsrA